MKKRIKIEVDDFMARGIGLFKEGMLLTSGDVNRSNTMTIAWGTIGSMWHYLVLIVGVRPERYTFDFMEKYPSFTVSSFTKKYNKNLGLFGTKSGRDFDKVKESGLTLINSQTVESPSFDEAQLIFECRTVYKDDLKEEKACDIVRDFYKERNYHRMYIGEITAIYGTSNYCSQQRST